MSEIISSKKEIEKIFSEFKNTVRRGGFHEKIYDDVLQKKIRFPLLENIAEKVFDFIPEKNQIEFCKNIIDFKTIGGNVIAGIILQKRMKNNFEESQYYAIEFMNTGNEWYSCDIITERVLGVALLNEPEKMFDVFNIYFSSGKNKTYSKFKKYSGNKWAVRGVGVAAHYAVKKGLQKKYIQPLFELLLSQSKITGHHEKTGIGWGAKTCVKFHNELISLYKNEIANAGQWFKAKVKIGIINSEYKKQKLLAKNV